MTSALAITLTNDIDSDLERGQVVLRAIGPIRHHIQCRSCNCAYYSAQVHSITRAYQQGSLVMRYASTIVPSVIMMRIIEAMQHGLIVQ